MFFSSPTVSPSALVLVLVTDYPVYVIVSIIYAILDQEELPVCDFSSWELDPAADTNMTSYVMGN